MTDLSNDIGRDRERAQVEHTVKRIINGGEMIDQEARDLANKALANEDAHERLCTERWSQSKEAMQRVEAALVGIRTAMDNKIGKVPAGVIAAMAGIIGWLADRAFPFH